MRKLQIGLLCTAFAFAVLSLRSYFQVPNDLGESPRPVSKFAWLENISFGNRTSQQMFGRRAKDYNREACSVFKGRLRTVAVVGNGPLTVQQRTQISHADLVMRFNKLNNRECGERMDIWAMRFGGDSKYGFHGLGEVKQCTTSEALEMTKAVWFVDGVGHYPRAKFIQEARVRFPALNKIMIGRIDVEELKRRYVFQDKNSSPSSGWLGLSVAMKCIPANALIHLYGFNWSRKHWTRHAMHNEELWAKDLAMRGKLVIHAPACGGLRTCGDCSVVAHHNKSGYVCHKTAVPVIGETDKLV